MILKFSDGHLLKFKLLSFQEILKLLDDLKQVQVIFFFFDAQVLFPKNSCSLRRGSRNLSRKGVDFQKNFENFVDFFFRLTKLIF